MVGIFLLSIGALIYLIDRPPGQTYLLFSLPFEFSLYNNHSPFFGTIGNYLPHFLHVSAFILLTAGLLNCGKRGYLVICLFWVIINGGFELGQKYSDYAAALVPAWFDRVYILENTKNYFMHGTYCHLDIAAIIIGGISGYAFLRYTNHRRGTI